MNPQLAALMEELLSTGAASDLPEAYAMAMKASGLTNSVGQIGASAVANTATGAATGAATKSGIAKWIAEHIGKDKALLNKDLNLPSLKNLGSGLRETSLWENGPKFSQAANTISGIYQGGKAVKGLYENTQKGEDLDSLKDDITLQMASNPMYANALDPEDERMLRQMKNGTLNNEVGNIAGGAIKGIPQAALTALLGGITGGPVGAIIGGVGSLANSGIEGYGKGLDRSTAKLQGLYGKLQQANEEYRSMRRPSGLRRAGLQSRYYNELY